MKYTFTKKVIPGKTGIEITCTTPIGDGKEAISAIHSYKETEITDEIKNILIKENKSVVSRITK